MKFKISASCGDIIYSLPFIKSVTKEATLYINNINYKNGQREIDPYDALKRLLESQSYIKDVLEYNNEEVDYDLSKPFQRDKLLKDRLYMQTFIPNSYFKAFDKQPHLEDKWLELETPEAGMYIFNETNTYNNYNVDFVKILKELTLPVYFIGTEKQHEKYQEFDRIVCHDLLEVAIYVNACQGVYCNQSAVLTLAQALNKPVYLAKDKFYNNTLKGNETLL